MERGPDAPLEDIARQAGVGIGTLYRRFANRQALMHAVVLDALSRTAEAAEQALAEEADGFSALAGYMHAALDLRVSAVIPSLLERLDLDDGELLPARDASAAATQRGNDTGHEDGTLPQEITFGDVGTLLVRMSRPLPGPMPRELQDQLAHRHLDLLIVGLRPRAGEPRWEIGGRGLSREALSALGDQGKAKY